MFVWNQPIDLHYYTRTIQGWPQVVFTVGKLDAYGSSSLVGYGFAYIPSQPGLHELEVSVWRPRGTPSEEIFNYFLGGVPHVTDKNMVNNPNKAKEERCRISTVYEGKIHVRFEVMLRNMKGHAVQTD
jgi:B9 domain-containing protein 2